MSCLMDFGEVNIPSSSAYWDCDEDEPAQENTTKLQLTFEAGQPEKAVDSQLFLIVEGLDAVKLIESVLLDTTEKICSIPTVESKSWLYKLKEKNILVAALEKDLTNSGEITELLLPYAQKAQQVVTLTITNKIYYKSEDLGDISKESSLLGINSKLQGIEELQPPNFITGVVAGIASWCSNKSLAVSSYVAYTHKGKVDVVSVEPIAKLLQQLGLSCSTFYNFTDVSSCYS
ncbi:uncharacterized protein LOC119680060 [Teleopsis dalmanni]|uniref:uncharacterized protein LOC119680060 n=1 Tax=Teleopsis dalmanni TaxID=139649 RepID=UPI0018CF2132|nr:uncharacterized protein LOC119680060 [Teleopsis dalmanni]